MARDFEGFIGKLTAEETRDLLGETVRLISDDYLFEALDDALSEDQKAECIARWQEQIDNSTGE